MNIRSCTAPIVLSLAFAAPIQAQAPLPAGWPNRLELGMGDGPGGAAAMKATAPFAFRYQYLAGGANTKNGWATWNADGDFARFYIQDSIANGLIPVFTYYMLLQSLPGGGSESDAVFTNLNTTSTMTAYYNDVKLFFQKAGAFPSQKVVLHVEPDFWGYMQQRASADNAAGVPAKVSETGLPELAGLPAKVAGFARAIVKLRDTYAPNVVLGYHISVWGTGNDIALSNPPDPTIDALATRASTFYKSLAAGFDIAFAEFSDRDSGFYQYVYGDGGAHWWDAEDFRRNARFLSGVSSGIGKRIVMWQIPLGNTKMRSQNNTTGHYQDNRTEWLFDEAARTHLARVSRRGSRRLPVRWRRRRHDLRLQRGERRHHQLRADQRQRHCLRGRDRLAGARQQRGNADARHARMPPTTTAGTSGGGRGGITRTVRCSLRRPPRRQRRPTSASFGE